MARLMIQREKNIENILNQSRLDLAAMTLHVDLVGPNGLVAKDVDRLEACVAKTAQLEGLFGDNPKSNIGMAPL